jgi:hypothetical protein
MKLATGHPFDDEHGTGANRTAQVGSNVRMSCVTFYAKHVEKLGASGMGVVYKGGHIPAGRFVALKFPPPDVVEDPSEHSELCGKAEAASVSGRPPSWLPPL